jgi:predicted HTH transcriptional regulator
MPEPNQVFGDPGQFWPFLTAPTDDHFEGQCFDRKEAGRVDASGAVGGGEISRIRKELIRECVSAFANVNVNGGLLVLGIGKGGEVHGVSHLTEDQKNKLVDIDQLLVHHGCAVKLHSCTNAKGQQDEIILILAPFCRSAICETVGANPRAWKRTGIQNLPLSDADRERLKRDKHIVDFQRTACAPYDPRDLDSGVLKEFRASYLSDALYEKTDEEVLYRIGAAVRSGESYDLTNAGCLFFDANPQRVLPSSYIRLLRFEVPITARDRRPLPTAEKQFSGPLTKQIRDFRNFLRESAFFKTYQRRNPDGGFTDEPEFPFNAVDETIVNAVAHRDYAIGLPILCEKYTDALMVRSPGNILQRNDLPSNFSLDEVKLEHFTRNPQLMEWLKTMKDSRGTSFVRALQEGTRQMREAMAELGLPAPAYTVTDVDTTVVLYNKAAEREAALAVATDAETAEYVNLYGLDFDDARNGSGGRDVSERKRREFLSALRDKLSATGWYVDSMKYGSVVAHRRGAALPVPEGVATVVKLYPAYVFQFREYWGRAFLVVDYTLTVQSVQPVSQLVHVIAPEDLIGLSAAAKWKEWERGRITAVDPEATRVFLFDFQREELIPSGSVIPRLPRKLIDALLDRGGFSFDLPREIKRASLALQPNGARIRAERTATTVRAVAREVFPLEVSGKLVRLEPSPVTLSGKANRVDGLKIESVEEPEVLFSGRRSTTDIRDGITRWGSYDTESRDVELVPVCSIEQRSAMASLIERLRTGRFKYRGSERTFHTRLTYGTIVTAPEADIASECRRLMEEHPDWCGDTKFPRLFLVCTPERGYSLDDERSPYYVVKRLLLEAGLPCQMVDTPTLANPDFKDLNLALNIVAKTGITPWVLPDSIPDADFFVGLSYTESHRSADQRLMAFANVFNEYGRWEFYSGSTEAFPYSERAAHYEQLIERTLSKLKLSETPSIYFHFSSKFSRDDKDAIVRGARRIRPKGKYVFVWLNSHHNIRLYDGRPETDGSVARGRFVVGSPNQFYLSTTGFNPYRKVLGTPHALEVNVHVDYPAGAPRQEPDLRALASQLLSLTKLNWASTDSLCAEPITTKYAGDIAYLTAAFLRQSGSFRLHSALEQTPWFI